MKTKRGLARAVPGMKVRLTGYFLKNTGQQVGSEGQSRWTVLACECGLCKTGDFACTNEPHDETYRTQMWGDLPESERPKYRHIALAHLQQIGAPAKASDEP